MNKKLIFTTTISLLCVGFFLTLFTQIITAQESYYEISIADKQYDIYEIRELKTETIIYYDIVITLRNSGNIISDDITIEIVGDDDVSLYLNGTISPGEEREFSWQDNEFFLIGAYDHYINITYIPTNPSITPTSYNSGTDQLILKYDGGDGNNGTPGFTPIICFLAIIVFFMVKKIKK